MILLKGGNMMESKNNNMWLYKSSIVFAKKLMRDNLINQQEYKKTIQKLSEIYNISSSICVNA